MLSEILERKMRERGLSARGVAAELGVSHTTVHRILDGETIDLDTLLRLSRWLQVRPSTLLDMEGGGEESSAFAAIAAVAEQDPRLANLLIEMARGMRAGRLDEKAVAEILSFAGYRLGIDLRRAEQAVEVAPRQG